MLKLKTIIIYFIFISPIVCANSPYEKFSELMDKTKTMTADFTLKVLDNTDNITQQSNGKMILKRPGKLIWNTHAPHSQSIIYNGKKVWVYDEDLDQVTIRKDLSLIKKTPVYILAMSPNDIESNYGLTIEKENALVNYVFYSLDAESEFEKLILSFKHGKLYKTVVFDKLQNCIKIEFNNIIINSKIKDKAFTFKIPDDVDVIYQ